MEATIESVLTVMLLVSKSSRITITIMLLLIRCASSHLLCALEVNDICMCASSLVPSPKSLHREGSGDIGTVSWLYRRVT